MGGGVGISINSPIRIATENTVWAMPETAIGLFPDVGATYFLPRLFNKNEELGLYTGLTGCKLKGKDLAYSGVATHFVKDQDIESLKKSIIESTKEDSDLKKLNEIIAQFSEVTYSEENFSFPNEEDIKKTFLVDSIEDIIKRLDTLQETGSEGEAKWAQKQKDILNKISPISALVVLEQMKRGIELKSLEEAFNLEAQLVASYVNFLFLVLWSILTSLKE